MVARSDFGTDGIRKKVGIYPVTPECFFVIGWAVAKLKKNKQNTNRAPTVCLANDGRASYAVLGKALEKGLLAGGAEVVDFGVLPTPGLAVLTTKWAATAGIMVTASHNDASYNGLKLFRGDGMKWQSEDIDQLVSMMATKDKETAESGERSGALEQKEWAEKTVLAYAKEVLAKFPRLGKKMKVVMDCAYGATVNIAKKMWEEEGFEVITMHTESTGYNINAEAGSTNTIKLQQAVLENCADLGVAFDGDGDRVVLIDEQGKHLDGDDIVYILAHQLRQNSKGVVTTVMSNGALTSALEKLGLEHLRVAVGDKHITQKLIQKDWCLGGEPSGHIMMFPFSRSGDGPLSGLACALTAFSRKEKLSDWRKELAKYPKKLVNYPLLSSDAKQQAWEAYLQQLQQEHQEVDMLLRKSGTEPLFRVTIEADNGQVLQSVLAKIEKKYAEYLV